MRQPLTATLAACCLVACLSCGSNEPSQDDVSIVNADRISLPARAVEGIHGAVPAGRSDGDAEVARGRCLDASSSSSGTRWASPPTSSIDTA